MKKALVALFFLSSTTFAQGPTVYPPEGQTGGLDATALGSYNLCVETAQTATTTGTVKETLATCTIPADSLGGTNDFAGFEVFASFKQAANANSKTGGYDFDGWPVADRITTGNDEAIVLSSICLVSESDKMLCQASLASDTSGNVVYTPQPTSTTVDLATDLDVTFFGTTPTQAGDITLTSYRVALISAYGSDPDSLPDAVIQWPLLAPDGLATATSYSFINRTTGGLWWNSSSGNINLSDTVAGDDASLYLNADPAAGDNLIGMQANDNGTGNISWVNVYAGDTLNYVELGEGSGNSFFVNPDGMQFSTYGSKPACASGTDVYIWVTPGGAGVADLFELCVKNEAETYAWTDLIDLASRAQSGTSTLTDGASTDILSFDLADQAQVAGTLITVTTCRDATNWVIRHDTADFICLNETDTETCDFQSNLGSPLEIDDGAGTFSGHALSFTGGTNAVTFTLNANCTLTPTSLETAWEIEFHQPDWQEVTEEN